MEEKHPLKWWTYSHLKHRTSYILTTRSGWPAARFYPAPLLTCKHGQRQMRTIYAWMQLQGRTLVMIWNDSNMTGVFETQKKWVQNADCNPKTFISTRSQGVPELRWWDNLEGSEQTVTNKPPYLRSCWWTHKFPGGDSAHARSQVYLITVTSRSAFVKDLLLFPLHAEMRHAERNGPQNPWLVTNHWELCL